MSSSLPVYTLGDSVPLMKCERDDDCTNARWDEHVANSNGELSPSQLDSKHFGLYFPTLRILRPKVNFSTFQCTQMLLISGRS